MSHFSVTVALPDSIISAPSCVDEAIADALERFDEEKEVVKVTEEDGESYWTNPDAKWDWYQIGGRWSHYLPLRHGADPHDFIVGERSWTNEDQDLDETYCDGARIRALDLDRKREAKAAQAVHDWNQYAAAILGTPQHRPWKEFVDRAKAAEDAAPRPWREFYEEAISKARASLGLWDVAARRALDLDSDLARRLHEQQELEVARASSAWRRTVDYTLDQARADYQAQPRIAALRAHPAYEYWFIPFPEDVFDHLSREEYVQQSRDAAIPGYATLTHDGQWIERGRMGWFGLSDETADSFTAYLQRANTYLNSLADDMILVVVDCHI